MECILCVLIIYLYINIKKHEANSLWKSSQRKHDRSLDFSTSTSLFLPLLLCRYLENDCCTSCLSLQYAIVPNSATLKTFRTQALFPFLSISMVSFDITCKTTSTRQFPSLSSYRNMFTLNYTAQLCTLQNSYLFSCIEITSFIQHHILF